MSKTKDLEKKIEDLQKRIDELENRLSPYRTYPPYVPNPPYRPDQYPWTVTCQNGQNS